MGSMWEQGDSIFRRKFDPKTWNGRDYVFRILTKNSDPFLDMKQFRHMMDGKDNLEVFYRIEGCQTFFGYLKNSLHRNHLDIRCYLMLMDLILEAMEEAENRMIMSASFEIGTDTIWYETRRKRVRFLYLPVRPNNDLRDADRWKSRRIPELLLELLEEVTSVDPSLSVRWPHFQSTYQNWMEENAGWNYCRRQIRTWLREFPEEKKGGFLDRYETIANGV